MKTKNKMLVFVEIAIVLCSLFLVALPTIAADQNQTTQKISASTITTASDDNHVLGVYGNANEDDTIDMRDLTYVKLIFFGKKPETELADAKYDGKINPLDFIQIKLIIVGKEKEITIVDSIDRIVTVNKPVERIIALGNYRTEAVKILGEVDKVVGISKYTKKSPQYFPELLELPEVGSWISPDYEQIIALEPDIVITSAKLQRCEACEEALAPVGIVVLGFDFYRINLLRSEIEKLGYVLDAENKAREYIEWREYYENIINDYVDDLSEEEKPKVYMEWGSEPGKSYGEGSSGDIACEFAGGRNIASELIEYPTVDMEWVLDQNPDVIVKYIGLSARWGWDDTEEPEELISDVTDSRPGWDTITAVKDNRFYVFSTEIIWGPDSIAGLSYFAKWFHPDLDIDPEGIYREYLEQFIDIEYPEDKIFVYPPL